jgi:hypothetical protein
MRGRDHQQSGMFSYVSTEQRVPSDYPLRAIRAMADAALKETGPRFDAMYANSGIDNHQGRELSVPGDSSKAMPPRRVATWL